MATFIITETIYETRTVEAPDAQTALDLYLDGAFGHVTPEIEVAARCVTSAEGQPCEVEDQ